MDLQLENKVALITGGASGVGSSIAFALAREGCDIALTHWEDPPGAAEVEEGIKVLGRRFLSAEVDAASFDDAEGVVARVLSELGRLDILVNAAALASDRVLWLMSEEQWDRVVAVNLKGCFNYCRAVADHFRERTAGRIVNLASIDGLRGRFGRVNFVAAKGGIVALTKAVAHDLGRYDVTVNAVAPGLVKSELTKHLPEKQIEEALRGAVLGRLAEPEDVANVVTFLCSPQARHITGQCLPVDGGLLM